MIDISCEVFDYVAKSLRSVYPGITVIGESVDSPARFPTVTIDEIGNTPEHMDSSKKQKYAGVTYRVQVFSNAENKRATARKIFNTVDELLMGVGFTRKTYNPQPGMYHAQIYEIRATYKGVADRSGVIYRR